MEPGQDEDEQYTRGSENDRCRDDRVLEPPGYQAVQKDQHNKSSDSHPGSPATKCTLALQVAKRLPDKDIVFRGPRLLD